MEIDRKKKEKVLSERRPFADCTNFITPPPNSRTNPSFASSSKSQFERPSVRAHSHDGDEIQSVGDPQPPPKEPSSSTSASFGADSWICVSGTDQSERLYKRRRLDAEKKNPSVGSLSCPPVVTRTRKPGNISKETPNMTGPSRVRTSASSNLKPNILEQDTRVEVTSSSERSSRICPSVSTFKKPKKYRHTMSEITVASVLPQDYIKEQTAHFAEIDAFELQEEEEEEASSGEQG